MSQSGSMLLLIALMVLVGGPLLLGFVGLFSARRMSTVAAGDRATPLNGRLMIMSALLYTLAFNLTFFIQELFLVLPKALTPGLQPTLFHNDHRWSGDNPLAALFQGTGALATLLVGGICAWLVRRGVARSVPVRLFLIWMAYCGIFMALPQVVIGAVSSGSDVGMAMDYLHLGAAAKFALALVALAVMPPIALGLARPLLGLAGEVATVASARGRTRFIFRVAMLPALAAILLIIPFRVPREFVEVVMLPVLVTVIGLAWMQAGAWRITDATATGGSRGGSIAFPLGAVMLLLLIFQVLLRPGIHFY